MHASEDITWHISKVSIEDRAILLSASGKSTLAYELERRLHDLGHANFVLDGDNIRHGLRSDLGFSPENRKENMRRVAEVARPFNDAGMVMIAAFISPYREDRALARNIIGPKRFIEVYLSADLSVCERRDPRGLHGKARAGEITGFTGISAPYEAPENPTIRFDTGSGFGRAEHRAGARHGFATPPRRSCGTMTIRYLLGARSKSCDNALLISLAMSRLPSAVRWPAGR
jgi:adenylyl-sulfate kinase